jgi:hypothetical protein
MRETDLQAPLGDVGNDSRLGEFIDRDRLRFVRDFTHPVDYVWGVLTDARQFEVWLWRCVRFEPRLGGRFEFDVSGQTLAGEITIFDPPKRLSLADHFLFELAPHGQGCRMALTLKRPPLGWSIMAIAGFHGWLGRLTRLLDGTPPAETEAWASEIWQSVFPAYELLVSRHVAGGGKPIYRLHFDANSTALDADAHAQLAETAHLMAERPELKLVIDGFGDDPCEYEQSLALCTARADAAKSRLVKLGVSEGRIKTGYLLGNYHYLVARDSEAGRAFNRRLELRPSF